MSERKKYIQWEKKMSGGAFENEWIIKSIVWSGEIKKLRGLGDISKKESHLRGGRIY